MRADDDIEKKQMKGQTEVKHNILQKYLRPWMFKISEVNSDILYIDGFAGWGYYPDGSPGSPILAMDVVEQNYSSLKHKLDNFYCTFIENNEQNHEELEQAVNEKQEECPPVVKPDPINAKFNDFATDFLDEVDRPIPTFIFIDPFGFSGVPFETVSELINMRETGVELFITFMSGKMAQFMETDTHSIAISEILGTEDWEDRVDLDGSKEERAEQFLEVYEDQLRNQAGVEYVWPFQMYEESKSQTAYYLVHATNHFDGHSIMKEIMFNEGADDQFAYLGPDHYLFEEEQMDLTSFGDENGNSKFQRKIESLADDLYERYKGEQTTLKQVMKETTHETPLARPHYKDAAEHLEEQNLLDVTHRPDRRDGNKSRGVGLDDDITFVDKPRLGDFCP
ncbi:three-Cys-motif partner protein TcmP [Halobacteria archaeon HArc-gm2]|nr:three-Cys-motif partner protein TcmP [Halobacteria archaeon HArc-gm2]